MQPKTKNAVFRCCWSSSLVYKVDSVGCGGVMSLSILCLVRHHHYEHNNAQTKIFSYPAPRVEPTMRASRDLGSDPFRSFGLYLVDLDPTANAGCAWPPRGCDGTIHSTTISTSRTYKNAQGMAPGYQIGLAGFIAEALSSKMNYKYGLDRPLQRRLFSPDHKKQQFNLTEHSSKIPISLHFYLFYFENQA